MKLVANIRYVTVHCTKGFQGQRSEVEVTCVQMCECYSGEGLDFNGGRRSYAAEAP